MKRSKFYQFFPPPKFLQMPAIGLDISDTAMRFVELVEKRKGFVIGRFGERQIPRGVIEGGEVKKPDELRTIFKDIKNVDNLEFVSVSLPEERAYLFELRLSSMKYSDIRGAIELVLEEHVPIKVDETIFDYDIVKEEQAFINVSVCVVPKSLVDGYLEAFSGSGIIPVAFEIEAHSIARALIPLGSGGTFMTVDFGKTRTGIAIVSEGAVQFTSTVPIGGGALTDLIVKTLNVSYDEAEKIKREKGIDPDNTGDELSEAVLSTVSVIRDEINKHQMYWQGHTDDYGKKREAIEKIYLCGGESNLTGFLEYLSSGVASPVELANALQNVNTLDNYIPEINFSDSLRYATALGLALRPSK